MSKEKLKPAKEQGRPAPSQTVPPPSAKPVTPPLLRKIDWLTFGITTLIVFIGYYLTLAPDLTLEDSGELAVGSLAQFPVYQREEAVQGALVALAERRE